jgi:hypothetical protein
MTLPFDTTDPRQMAALLVFLEYNPDDIVETLVTRFATERTAALDLVHDLLHARIEHADKTEQVQREHLAAVAAEHDLTQSMHGGTPHAHADDRPPRT